MAQIIELVDEDKRPRTVCPHCKTQININLDTFKKDCTKIVETDCPMCKRTIMLAILIMADINHYRISQVIQTVVEAASEANKVIGGKRIE